MHKRCAAAPAHFCEVLIWNRMTQMRSGIPFGAAAPVVRPRHWSSPPTREDQQQLLPHPLAVKSTHMLLCHNASTVRHIMLALDAVSQQVLHAG